MRAQFRRIAFWMVTGSILLAAAATAVSLAYRDQFRRQLTTKLRAQLSVWGTEVAPLKALTRAGADPNSRGKEGETPLLIAAAMGDLVWTRELLRAVRWWHPEITEELLLAEADPGLKDNDGITPLTAAYRNGFPYLASKFRAAGAQGPFSPPTVLSNAFRGALQTLKTPGLYEKPLRFEMQHLSPGSDGSIRITISRPTAPPTRRPIPKIEITLAAFDSYIGSTWPDAVRPERDDARVKKTIRLREGLLRASNPLWAAGRLGARFDAEIRELEDGYAVRFTPHGANNDHPITVALDREYRVRKTVPSIAAAQ